MPPLQGRETKMCVSCSGIISATGASSGHIPPTATLLAAFIPLRLAWRKPLAAHCPGLTARAQARAQPEVRAAHLLMPLLPPI
jgi:hypothetical protein